MRSQLLSTAELQGELYLFAKTADDHLVYKTHDGYGWNYKWKDLGNSVGPMISQPAATAWRPEGQDDRIDVFVVTSSASSVWSKSLQSLRWGSWSDWEAFADEPASQVIPCNPTNSRLDLWVTTAGGPGVFRNSWYSKLSDGDWNFTANDSGEDLNMTTSSAPAVLCRNSDVIHDVVWYDRDPPRLWHRQAMESEDAKGWQNATSMPGSFVGDPTLFSSEDNPERIDIFCVQEEDYQISHFSWDSGREGHYSSRKVLKGEVRSVPSVVSLSRNNLDVFTLSGNGTLQHIHYDGSEWDEGWWDFGVKAKSAPLAITFAGKLFVFVIRSDGEVRCLYWDPDDASQVWRGWLDWDDMGGEVSVKYY